MDHADHMRQSIDVAVAAIRGADPARYGDPSPCTEYTVGQVVSHLAFGFLLAQHAAHRQEWDPEWKTSDTAPYLQGLPESEWAQRAADHGELTARAWADPQVWEGDTTFGGGPMPAAAVGSMMIAEFVVHGWDVAVGSGRRLEVAPGLAEVVLDGVEAIAPMGRDGGWFAAQVPLPDGATAFDRALAASGRDPNWERP